MSANNPMKKLLNRYSVYENSYQHLNNIPYFSLFSLVLMIFSRGSIILDTCQFFIRPTIYVSSMWYQAWNLSWKQPVLSNEGKGFWLKVTTTAFARVKTHDRVTDYVETTMTNNNRK